MSKISYPKELLERAETMLRTYAQKRRALRLLEETLELLRQTAVVAGDPEAAAFETRCRELELRIGLAKAELLVAERMLECLDTDERLVVERMLIEPIRDAAGELSEALCVETATVYRRRRRALEKLAAYLY